MINHTYDAPGAALPLRRVAAKAPNDRNLDRQIRAHNGESEAALSTGGAMEIIPIDRRVLALQRELDELHQRLLDIAEATVAPPESGRMMSSGLALTLVLIVCIAVLRAVL
jgi:hypothetical protein